ncbi:MAG: hypothetical protein HYU64_15600 [Armatimonadetes bacterium]|nr:hypothetical protein [Armatimonadota bacterium]
MIRFILAVALLWAFSPSLFAEDGEMSCLKCHKKIREMTATDVHSQHGVLCTSCHRGDPSDYSIRAMSGKKSHFKGKPSRSEIPSLCGSCHSRPDIMTAYGLPSSQEGEYLKSRHGRLWAKGDTRVPVCTTCHGAHGILPKDDPATRTSRANVNALCDSCHGHARIIRNPKVPTDQYVKYRKSVHGKAFDGNNKRAPTCALCHGHHTTQATLVEKSFSVCDRCHGGTAYQVSQSPHQKPIEERKIKQCVACHGYHDIQRPEAEKMEGICRARGRPIGTGLRPLLIHGASRKRGSGQKRVRTGQEGAWGSQTRSEDRRSSDGGSGEKAGKGRDLTPDYA